MMYVGIHMHLHTQVLMGKSIYLYINILLSLYIYILYTYHTWCVCLTQDKLYTLAIMSQSIFCYNINYFWFFLLQYASLAIEEESNANTIFEENL